MKFLERFRKTDPLPEVAHPEDDLQSVEQRCLELGKQREALQLEYRKMAAEFQLLPDVLGVPHPQIGNPEIVSLVANWWVDFIKRSDVLTNAHNRSMQQVAAMHYHEAGY